MWTHVKLAAMQRLWRLWNRPWLHWNHTALVPSLSFPGETGHLSSGIWNLGVFSRRCTGESLPLRVDFTHRVEFEEVCGIDVSADTFQGCRKTSEKMWFCGNSDAAGIKVRCKRKRILYTVSDSTAGWNGCLFKCMCKMRSTNTWQFLKKRRETCF